MNDECLRASFSLLCLDRTLRARPNPQELLPCERCGRATCGWCEACGPLWNRRVKPTPICSLCDDEGIICEDCKSMYFSWDQARRTYRQLYPEIYEFKTQGTWQAHVRAVERQWLRRQFRGESEWMPQPDPPADVVVPLAAPEPRWEAEHNRLHDSWRTLARGLLADSYWARVCFMDFTGHAPYV